MRDKLIFWINDNTGAILSVNKGSCHSAESIVILDDIYAELDARRSYIVGFWDPRTTANAQWADYLTHLASHLDRDCSGRLSQISGVSSSPSDTIKAGPSRQTSTSSVPPFQALLSPEALNVPSCLGIRDREVSVSLCRKSPRVGEQSSERFGSVEEMLPQAHETMAICADLPPSVQADQRTQVPRRVTFAAERTVAVSPDTQNHSQTVVVAPGSYARVPSPHGIRRPPSPRRALTPASRKGRRLAQPPIFQVTPVPDKDSPTGVADLGDIPFPPTWPVCSPSTSKAFRSAQSMAVTGSSALPIVVSLEDRSDLEGVASSGH